MDILVVLDGTTLIQGKLKTTGVNGSTPGDVCIYVTVKHAPSPVLIGIVATSSPCGLSGRLQVAKKKQYISPGLGGNTQNLDTVIDGKLPNDLDYESIFSKVICHKLFDSSKGDLYSRCRKNFANYPVKTQDPHFMDLGFRAMNTLIEISDLGTPVNSIQRPADGSHWHVFGEGTTVGMSAAKSDHNYN